MEFIERIWNDEKLLMFLGIGIIVVGIFVKKKRKKEKEDSKNSFWLKS